ncbi:SRPBCC family protein [Zhihengliuella somnathii]
MATARESIDVLAPVDEVYAAWADVQSFPRFMTAVAEVRPIDDATHHWFATIAGVTREFTTRITEQEPGRLIAWETTEGLVHAGRVTFEEIEVADPEAAPRRLDSAPFELSASGLAGRVPAATVQASAVEGNEGYDDDVPAPRGVEATRVSVDVEWDDATIVQTLGDKLGLDDRRVKHELRHFKEYVENNSADR